MNQVNVSFDQNKITVDRNGFSKTVVYTGPNTEDVADAILAALQFNADKTFVKKDGTLPFGL